MNSKAPRVRYETPVVKMAVERKLVSPKQHQQCRELVRKSRKIGLETTMEEVLVKQEFLTKEQLEELQEISQLGEGGDFFGGHRLVKLIGQGGMGKVYEAVHEYTSRRVALKIFSTSFTGDETNFARYFQEVRALAKLSHPNIVTLYDAAKGGRRYFFTMELVDGMSLSQYVEKNGRFTEQHALSIIGETAKALAFSHNKNIIHRDVKPENILIDNTGKIKVTDFGVVMHRDDDHLTLTKQGFMVGSVHFVSPEQIKGIRDLDGRSDIYSLGATLFFMLTGRPMYTGDCMQNIIAKHTSAAWVSPKKYNRFISLKTVRIMRKMMAKKREHRYQSMNEVIKAIDGSAALSKAIRLLLQILTGLFFVALGIAAEALFTITGLLS